jgi:hypothetical protein
LEKILKEYRIKKLTEILANDKEALSKLTKDEMFDVATFELNGTHLFNEMQGFWKAANTNINHNFNALIFDEESNLKRGDFLKARHMRPAFFEGTNYILDLSYDSYRESSLKYRIKMVYLFN